MIYNTEPIVYMIEKITDRNGNERIDGRYPSRIGSYFIFQSKPMVGKCMLLGYVDWPSMIPIRGILRTSTVKEIWTWDKGSALKIGTVNSIYHFKAMAPYSPSEGVE